MGERKCRLASPFSRNALATMLITSCHACPEEIPRESGERMSTLQLRDPPTQCASHPNEPAASHPPQGCRAPVRQRQHRGLIVPGWTDLHMRKRGLANHIIKDRVECLQARRTVGSGWRFLAFRPPNKSCSLLQTHVGTVIPSSLLLNRPSKD